MPSGVNKFEIKRASPLHNVRQEVARRESTTADRVCLFYNDTPITATDTVDSLGRCYISNVPTSRFQSLLLLLLVLLLLLTLANADNAVIYITVIIYLLLYHQ